jgi:hypothetical protein
MKKAAKKTVKAKAKVKVVPKTKAKSAAKPAKKAKSAPKKKSAVKTKPVAKKAPSAKAKPVAKPKPMAKKTAVVKAKPPVKVKPVAPPKPAAPAAPPPPPPAPVLSSSGQGTSQHPWTLKTPAGFSEFQAYKDEASNPPSLVVKVGSTELRYHLRALTDLHEMLKARGDWILLGSADEQQPVVDDTVEAWARSLSNPIGGFYGLKPGLRGRFATYVPQVMEALGMAEVEHFPNNNRMRAK